MTKQNRVFVGDFETTVFDGQDFTEVWASALVELGTEDVYICSSIDEQWDYIKKLNCSCRIYYHNLKFDGEFWLYYFIHKCGYKQAYHRDENGKVEFKRRKELKSGEFIYSISSMGQWYSLIIKYGKNIIEFRDSLKLLPFSVKRIGESFKTKHKKLDMEYKGFRYAGCTITTEERKYIANDVLVVKEALEIMFEEGHDKLTIGSCCLSEYKEIIGKYQFEDWFPQLSDVQDDFIRNAYKGGWCYVVHGKENKVYNAGVTLDVNSLYPSVMHSQSGSRYPVGHPHFFMERIPEKCWNDDIYFFIHLKTRFYLKKNKLPFIQVKNNLMYRGNECLETSDIYDRKTGQYYRYNKDGTGNIVPAIVELTLTKTDYILMLEHYDLEDTEIIDGCWFNTEIGIFDEYIDKYKEIKVKSTGALRELAKLFLNNLYGKMATGRISSFKIAYENEDGALSYDIIPEMEKKPVYIPVGAAITSYARNFTIRTAQKNYYGKKKAGFIYADTDSIHCDLPIEKIKGVTLHPTDFCCWKHETDWDKAIFARQKTYIEHVIREDCKDVEPYYNIKCAGMPQKCKDLLVSSFTQEYDPEKLNEDELYFVQKPRTMKDFKVGLRVPGKLMPKHIAGGVLLVDTTYEMR